jgi:hypothetical protein
LGELYYDTGTSTLYWWNGTAWVSAAGGSLPTVVNGQFLKGVSGAAVWSAITSSDISALGLTGLDSRTRIQGGIATPLGLPGAAHGSVSATITLPTAWANQHLFFFGQSWPLGTWSGYGGVVSAQALSLTQGQVMFDNTTAQNVTLYWISLGY